MTLFERYNFNENRSLLYLKDILDSINKIADYTRGVDDDFFFRHPMMVDAVIRNLEVIGEASKNVSDEIRGKYPEIPWKKMTGLRNIVIREYFGIDESIVWEMIKTNLPEVKPWIEKAIQEIGDIT